MTKLISFATLTCLLMAGCGQATAIAPDPAAPEMDAPAVEARALSATGPSTPSPEGASIEMLTYNTWGKPGIFGKDQKSRFELLGPAIRGYDLVTLQETFTGYAKTMAKLSQFPYLKHSDNGDLFHLGAGLYTLSKFRILETDFAKFKEAGDFDVLANKGVQFTRLDVPGVGEVDLYTTHFQSRQPAKFAEIRLYDNTVLEAIVKKHAKGNPTIVSGDFNMKPDSKEYLDLKRRLSFRDAFAEANPGQGGYTSGPPNPYKEPDATPKRVDYIFVLPCERFDIGIAACKVTMDQPVGGKFLSDHFGVQAKLTIKPRP